MFNRKKIEKLEKKIIELEIENIKSLKENELLTEINTAKIIVLQNNIEEMSNQNLNLKEV